MSSSFLHNKYVLRFLGRYAPKILVSLFYWRMSGRKLDWKNPRDINEKIQWLKFHSDTTLWTQYADKYAVRDHIRECGLEDMLVPLYGKWDSAEDIDWDELPDSFVLKTNHGSGDAIICQDKAKLEREEVIRYFNEQLKRHFGCEKGEPHYDKIRPCLLAEKLLDAREQEVKSTSLVDYKIWTFDGKPAYIWACHNRTKESCVVGVYDLDWTFHPEYSVSTPHYILSSQAIPAPRSLNRMLEAASILSKGFPELRIDFYDVGGKAYFGEMTFSSASGLSYFFTSEFLNILGDCADLSKVKCK